MMMPRGMTLIILRGGTRSGPEALKRFQSRRARSVTRAPIKKKLRTELAIDGHFVAMALVLRLANAGREGTKSLLSRTVRSGRESFGRSPIPSFSVRGSAPEELLG